jgi:hypothetical protein
MVMLILNLQQVAIVIMAIAVIVIAEILPAQIANLTIRLTV